MPSGQSSKMATKNCPQCESANPVASKKCSCGHVFYQGRRSAHNTQAQRDSAEDISEPTTPQEPEVPRRRTTRVARSQPQYYDALEFDNELRRQRELNKRRKASKSDDVEGATEEVVEKPAPVVATSSKRRPESPQAKVAEPPAKKRRGRPPGLTNNKRPGRPQILRVSDGPPKPGDGVEPVEDEKEAARDIHAIAPVKQLQMNMVLGDINSRIASSSVRAEAAPPAKKTLPKKKGRESRKKEIDVADTKEEPISDKDQSEAVEKTVEEKNKLGFEEEIRKKKEEEDGPRKREGDELKKDEADGVVCKDNTELKNIDGGDAKATDNVVDSKMAEEKKGADESSCSAKPEKLTNGDAISIRNEAVATEVLENGKEFKEKVVQDEANNKYGATPEPMEIDNDDDKIIIAAEVESNDKPTEVHEEKHDIAAKIEKQSPVKNEDIEVKQEVIEQNSASAAVEPVAVAKTSPIKKEIEKSEAVAKLSPVKKDDEKSDAVVKPSPTKKADESGEEKEKIST